MTENVISESFQQFVRISSDIFVDFVRSDSLDRAARGFWRHRWVARIHARISRVRFGEERWFETFSNCWIAAFQEILKMRIEIKEENRTKSRLKKKLISFHFWEDLKFARPFEIRRFQFGRSKYATRLMGKFNSQERVNWLTRCYVKTELFLLWTLMNQFFE